MKALWGIVLGYPSEGYDLRGTTAQEPMMAANRPPLLYVVLIGPYWGDYSLLLTRLLNKAHYGLLGSLRVTSGQAPLGYTIHASGSDSYSQKPKALLLSVGVF